MQLSGGSSPTRRPRLAVFTSTSHPSLKVTLRHDLTTDPDAQALEIQAHGIPSLILYHVYNQQVNGDGVFTIERLFTRASVLPKRCILAGDFNAHHLWWNSNTSLERNAETLVPLLEDHHFDLLNEPDVCTHFPANGNNPSVLDLTFASPDIFDAISGWSQDKQAGTGSDHAVIRFQLDSPQDLDPPIPSPPRYNWKKADWEAFTQALQAASLLHQDDWNQLFHDATPDKLDKAAELLRHMLLDAVKEAVPISRVCTRSKAWWTPKITENRQYMIAEECKWKWKRTEPARYRFRVARQAYFRSIQRAKEEFFDKYLADTGSDTLFDVLKMTRPKRSRLIPTLHTETSVAVKFEEKAALFRKTLFPPPPAYAPSMTPPLQPSYEWTPVTDDEIKAILFACSPKKAPGPDGVNFACLRHAYTALPSWFNMLYRTVLNLGYHPRSWREATGAIVPKPKKADYTAVKSYRIVSLLNCMGKVAEKLVAFRLAQLCEDKSLLHNGQMGGRKHRSSQDAVMALVHDIELGWSRGLTSSALLLDVKGAFDNVSKVRLLESMTRMRIPKPLVEWVSSFMSDRLIALAFDGSKEELQPVNTGIPQGSPCSPILFLIYLKPLFDELERHKLNIQTPSYIDDVAIMVTGKSTVKNAATLQKAAAIAFEWARQNAIAFDDSKSELIHFANSNKVPTCSMVLPNGTELHPLPSVRWLGILLDRKLSFRPHVENRIAAAGRALSSLLRLSTTEKGLTLSNMRQLYQACILPVIDFGSEVWWKGYNQDYLVKRIQLVQNTASRRILGAFRSTPTDLLDVEAALLPANIRLQYNQRRYAVRLLRLPESHPVVQRCPELFHPTADGITDKELGGAPWHATERTKWRYPSRLIRVAHSIHHLLLNGDTEELSAPETGTFPANLELSALPTAPIRPEYLPVPYTPPTSKSEAAAAHLELLTTLNPRRHLVFYSDGSKLDNKIGAGVYLRPSRAIPAESHSFSLGSTSEVFDAELQACYYACVRAKALARRNRTITDCWVFLDNTSVIHRLKHTSPTAGQALAIGVHEVANALDNLGVNLHIQWVPGHEGVPGNDEADRLAKEGSKKRPATGYQVVSHAFLKRSIRQQAMTEWAIQWEQRRSTRSFMGSPKRRIHPILAHASKRDASRVIQIRSGHGYFNAYLGTIPKSGVLRHCSCGNYNQTPEHLVLYCRRYAQQRQDHLQHLITRAPDGSKRLDIFSAVGTQQLLLFLQATPIALRPQVAREWVSGFGDISQDLD